MSDNVPLPAVTGRAASDEVSFSGQTDAQVQLIRPVGVTGSEGAKTVLEWPFDSTFGVGFDLKRFIDNETGFDIGRTILRELLVAMPYTEWADSLADGLSAAWTSTTANGGTATSSGGEGLIQTSANANGSAQIIGPTIPYHPGQLAWFKSAVRMGDTGASGNTRRIGVFTVSGTTPQNGAYYELTGTTLNAVVVNGGTPSATASGSWSKFSTAPFTLDTSYHQLEIRFTANTVLFYIDNVLRHVVTGTTAAITATLNFPIGIQSINSGAAATNYLIAVRNCGRGGYGTPEPDTVVAHGANPTAMAVGQRTKGLSNRHGSRFVIGGHPNTITYTHSAITTAVTDTAMISVGSGSKIVVTAVTVTLDNASTVFPSVRIGFGTANVPALGNPGILLAHGGLPAGGGVNRGDGSGILGIGADGEDVRITTVGNATGNGVQVTVTYYTIES